LKKLKIFICCPGSWSAGLNSPERGEGRWAQNWAKMLGAAGHTVTACSAGYPPQRNAHPGVTLVGEHERIVDGPYDIYIDTAWWEVKVPKTTSRFYFRVHWGLESFLLKPGLPENHCIIYPYESTGKINFKGDHNPYTDRTFWMPVPLRASMAEPAFNRKDILIPAHASPAVSNNPANAKIAVDKIYSYLEKGYDFRCHWLFGEQLRVQPYAEAARNSPPNTVFHSRMEYNKVVDIIDQCRLTVQLNSCSCAVDSVVAGVPFVAWETGGFFTEIAAECGILIGSNEETKERIEEVIDILMTNEEVYTRYVLKLQEFLYGHTEDTAIEIFNDILEKMGI